MSIAFENSIFMFDVNDRIDIDLELVERLEGQQDDGTRDRNIYTFADDRGNCYVWKTFNDLSYEGKTATAGDRIRLIGTVKAHSVYRNIKQTVLSYCKIVAID